MVIETVGDIDPELWAAADVVGASLVSRVGDTKNTSVWMNGYMVKEFLKWTSYKDLVAKLKAIKLKERRW